jgi:hypothetical protein
MDWIDAFIASIFIIGFLGFCLLLLIAVPAIIFIGMLAVGAIIVLAFIIKLLDTIGKRLNLW